MRRIVLTSAFFLALLAVACGKTSPGYEFMPDMARSVPYDAFDLNPVTKNGQTLQRPVPGTVARGSLPFRYAATPEEAERAGRELLDPFPPSPEVLARGEKVYRTFCWVCHGETGQGDGPITTKFPPPPSYTSERVRALPEGHIFHVITRGTALMPSYAAQISPEDRWKAIRYVQQLQHAVPREARK